MPMWTFKQFQHEDQNKKALKNHFGLYEHYSNKETGVSSHTAIKTKGDHFLTNGN